MSAGREGVRHYAERNIVKQGQPYFDHVKAMTAEGLHAKSAIAAELAHRDIEIATLTAELGAMRELVASMQAVINAASILENASASDENDCMDEAFELQAALVKYRAALSSSVPK
jgi:hypothetical protein